MVTSLSLYDTLLAADCFFPHCNRALQQIYDQWGMSVSEIKRRRSFILCAGVLIFLYPHLPAEKDPTHLHPMPNTVMKDIIIVRRIVNLYKRFRVSFVSRLPLTDRDVSTAYCRS